MQFNAGGFALAAGSGIYQDETETEEVVVIGEALVDYMHAKSHLYDIAKQAWRNVPRADSRLGGNLLYAGNTQEVGVHIRALGKSRTYHSLQNF